jgi:ribonuclease HII
MISRYSKDPQSDIWEIGVDEAGRGPLFGPVYAAAVMLPGPDDASGFRHDWMKDSKKFSSRQRRDEVAAYIREHALAWCVCSEDAATVDRINILQATLSAMHAAVAGCMEDAEARTGEKRPGNGYHVLVDGNTFRPLPPRRGAWVPHTCIEGGDRLMSAIAAASILAKTAHDDAIDALCDANPTLDDRYDLRSNKGYGTARHRVGLGLYGPSPWHRRTFGGVLPRAVLETENNNEGI